MLETMKDESQTAADTAVTEETLQQESASSGETTDSAGASDLDAATENESQEQSQEAAEPEQALGDNAADDQPVTAPTVAGTQGTPEARYAAMEKENTDLKAMIRETMEVIKQRESLDLKAKATQSTVPKGQWKEKLSKHFQGPDAAVLSEALEAALSERLGDVDNIKQDVSFMKPWLERFGVEHELSKGANALVAAGVPQSVVAKLHPTVEAALKAGVRAPAEYMYRAAYADHAMKEKSALATKTLQARQAKKPVAPAPKNSQPANTTPKFTLTPPKPGADPVEEMTNFLKQVKKY